MKKSVSFWLDHIHQDIQDVSVGVGGAPGARRGRGRGLGYGSRDSEWVDVPMRGFL